MTWQQHNGQPCLSWRADAAVLDAVLNKILSPDFVDALLDEIKGQIYNTNELDAKIVAQNERMSANERAIKRLVRAAENTDDIDEISKRLRELKHTQYEISAQIKHLQAERNIELPPISREALDYVFGVWRSQIQAYFQSGDILSAKNLIAQFVQRIDIGYNELEITYTYPVVEPTENSDSLSAHLFGGRLQTKSILCLI